MKKIKNILRDIPNHNYSEPAIDIDRQQFINVVKSRRSVRVFSEDIVDHNDINECLELALLAPTSSNLQCWEFYWIKNNIKKESLKKYCLSQSAATTAQELIVCVSRMDTWKALESESSMTRLVMSV